MTKEMQIEVLQARKAILAGRGKDNYNICRKLDRKINKIKATL